MLALLALPGCRLSHPRVRAARDVSEVECEMRVPCGCRCFFRGGACQPQIWMHPHRRTRHARHRLGKDHVVPAALGKLPPSPGATRPIDMALEMEKVSEQTTKPGRDHHSPWPTRHAWGRSSLFLHGPCAQESSRRFPCGDNGWMMDTPCTRHFSRSTEAQPAPRGGGIQPGEALFKLADPFAIFS
jgi:hypothetical protein